MKKLAVILVLLSSCRLWADVVVLKDGTRLEGELKRTADGWTITPVDGKTQSFAADAIKSIERRAAGAREGLEAASALASLRRSVEALSDLDQIIARYARFIDNTKDDMTVGQARDDLVLWQQRKENGLVKYGGQWVPPAMITELAAAATMHAIEARDLLRQNQTRQADQVLQQALATDPHNPAAQYLRGVMLYRQDKLLEARKAFDAVNADAPQHAPTLNNLAVILWRMNQQSAAMNLYDQAMQAAPVNEFILNNVTEALGSIPEEQRRGISVSRALRRFAEQDQLLQQQLAQQGRYRWGSAWVDEKKLDELKSAEREIRKKLDEIQVEFNQAQVRISAIGPEISANEQRMNDLRSFTVFRDPSGVLIAVPPPPQYYELQAQNRQLAAEQENLQAKLGTLQQQAKRTQQELPVPRFTGIQQIVGVEGMPAAAAGAVGAASRPATE